MDALARNLKDRIMPLWDIAPTQLARVELESTPLDHSGKVSGANKNSETHTVMISCAPRALKHPPLPPATVLGQVTDFFLRALGFGIFTLSVSI